MPDLALDAHCLAERRTGVGTYVANLVRGIREIGKAGEVALYLHTPARDADGFRTVLVPPAPMWTTVRLSARFARRGGPAAMLFPSHALPLIPPKASVVTIHDLAFELFPEHFTMRDRLRLSALTRHAVRRADHVIAVSEATRRDACELLGIDESRISVVHHGYDADRFRPATSDAVEAVRRRYGIRRPYVISVGTLQSRKNHVTLVQSLERLLERGYDLDLVLVGGRGWLYEELFRAVAGSPARDRVVMLDYVSAEDLPALYSGAEASALVSLYEGFGLPVLEALGCGIPTLVSNGSSLLEVGGDAVLTVDPRDADAIATGLESILTDSDLRAELRRRAAAHLANFSWTRCASETLHVLRQAAHAG